CCSRAVASRQPVRGRRGSRVRSLTPSDQPLPHHSLLARSRFRRCRTPALSGKRRCTAPVKVRRSAVSGGFRRSPSATCAVLHPLLFSPLVHSGVRLAADFHYSSTSLHFSGGSAGSGYD